MLPQPLPGKRRRLQRISLFAAALVLAGCGFGFVESLTVWVSPKPDYYRLLFTELARQTSMQTGTPTIIKEETNTLAMFEREYNLRNTNFGLPSQRIVRPKNSLMQYSYPLGTPIGDEVVEISFSQILQQQTRPFISHNEAGWHPVAIWVYSKEEELLACFVHILQTPDHPFSNQLPTPGSSARMIRQIDWSGVVSVQGSVPDVKTFLEHAYLIPLEDLKLENIDPRAVEPPNFWVLYHVVPAILGSGYTAENAPATLTAGETLVLLQAQAMRPFVFTQRAFRFGVLPLGLVWLAVCFWRMRRLQLEFSRQIDELLPASFARKRLGFLSFQIANLEDQVSAIVAEARVIEARALSAEREKAEMSDLKDELRRYVVESQLASEEEVVIERPFTSESLSELRSLASDYRLKRERERQIVREREREIQWLESEFEALPPLTRVDAAREAWDLYQRAITVEDPRLKLHGLKEARKKLPKDLLAGRS